MEINMKMNVKINMNMNRFWYETSEASVRFTEAQLTEIRKATLAKVIFFIIIF